MLNSTKRFQAALLKSIHNEDTAHEKGIKHVFMQNSDTNSALTQLAYGYMGKGEESGLHCHNSMDEYFFFIAGKGIFNIEGETAQVLPETFFRIPAGALHNLIHTGAEQLEFVYFGITTSS